MWIYVYVVLSSFCHGKAHQYMCISHLILRSCNTDYVNSHTIPRNNQYLPCSKLWSSPRVPSFLGSRVGGEGAGGVVGGGVQKKCRLQAPGWGEKR